MCDQLTETDLRDWTQQMLRAMRQNNPHLAIELNVSRVKEDVALRNTNGGEAHLARSWLEAETWIERHENGEVLVVLDALPRHGWTTATSTLRGASRGVFAGPGSRLSR